MKSPPKNDEAPAGDGASGTTPQENRRVQDSTVRPEFGSSRRRFLVAMFMIGAVPPERVVERVLADVEQDLADRGSP